ncbi:glycosyltransferase [Sphingomonas prati]|uniref:glycosyltransferase n=1 Tax=Sphingomonas prati TaxID=1843237 RepID=UPI0016666C0A|nr:glycosyltransferase [Sphingomonas prati]
MTAGLFADLRTASYRKRGDRARDRRHWHRAVVAYRHYLDERPDDVAIRIQLGHALREMGDPAAAEIAYARADAATPRDPNLLICWGHLRKSIGDIEGARRLYGDSAAINGNMAALNELAALPETRPPFEPPHAEAPAVVQGPAAEPTAPAVPEPAAVPPPVSDAPAWATDLAFAKPVDGAFLGETVLFLACATGGRLPAHVAPFVDALIDGGHTVILLVVTDRPVALPPTVVDRVAGALVRRDTGSRFAAWAHALKLLPALYGAPGLTLIDDGLAGDFGDDRFATVTARMRTSEADLVALTGTMSDGWHVDCGYVRLSRTLLASEAVQLFFDAVKLHADPAAPAADDTAFLERVQTTGHRIETLFPDADLRTLTGWRRLSALGLPFVPPALGQITEAPDVQDALRAAGLDPSTSGYVVDTPPADGPLLATPPRQPPADMWPTVRYYAPVNYAGVDGDAARAMLCSLRRLPIRLNVHPIQHGYRDATPIAPPADAIDFETPADIAIVQLDPDDWHLLTDQQRGLIADARRTIGYWTAPCDDRLVSRVQDFHAIDRIWVTDPTGAAQLDRRDGAAVAVIPDPQAWGRDDATDEALLAAVHATLADTTTDRRVHRPVPKLRGGILLDESTAIHDAIRLVLLAADGAPLDTALPDPADDRWILFAPTGACIAPDFADIVMAHIAARPDASLFYADDIAAETEFAVDHIRLKPEYDRTLLAAQDYVGAPLLVRASALVQLGGLAVGLRTAAIADLLFRADSAGLAIARIPHVLLGHRGQRVCTVQADQIAMLHAQPSFGGFDIVPGAAESVAIRRRFVSGAEPAVTLLIPTMRTPVPWGDMTLIEQLLIEIARADWPMERLTVIVGDDGEGVPDWAERRWPFALTRIATARAPGEPFNYAAKMNRLWRAAETEQIVMMNDDLVPTGYDWLNALLTFAVDPTVGGVGARLLFTDGSIQHAGIGPVGTGATHLWVRRRHGTGAYQGWTDVQREWSMVTGAVFATRRSVMARVGGFDERFSLEYNDTDLCLRLRTLGYRIVYTPLAEMIHSEKASRGHALPPGDETAAFRSRWRAWLDQDPSWHPRLHRDRIDLTPQYAGSAWYA